ncbi:MAG: HTH domain-containing protein, partial [Anaerolineae bacterium]|nr:HTH domain-containing protein [Anaerolineae bacterium]
MRIIFSESETLMRADRLLSLLMLLQTRGQMTAETLAHELEVTPRTIYRDLETLEQMGVPLVSDRGPGGGYALLDSYRTSLTGFTQEEIQSLFMLTVPNALDQLGVGSQLKMALLKLAAALPFSRRQTEQQVRQRIYLDSAGWFHQEENTPHLRTIHQAVWHDQKLHLTVRLSFDTQVERVVAPYGLVAKTSVWYLVYT